MLFPEYFIENRTISAYESTQFAAYMKMKEEDLINSTVKLVKQAEAGDDIFDELLILLEDGDFMDYMNKRGKTLY